MLAPASYCKVGLEIIKMYYQIHTVWVVLTVSKVFTSNWQNEQSVHCTWCKTYFSCWTITQHWLTIIEHGIECNIHVQVHLNKVQDWQTICTLLDMDWKVHVPEAIPYCGFSGHFSTFNKWSISCKRNNIEREWGREGDKEGRRERVRDGRGTKYKEDGKAWFRIWLWSCKDYKCRECHGKSLFFTSQILFLMSNFDCLTAG